MGGMTWGVLALVPVHARESQVQGAVPVVELVYLLFCTAFAAVPRNQLGLPVVHVWSRSLC